jgi:integrase
MPAIPDDVPTLRQYATRWLASTRARVRPRTAYLYDFIVSRYLDALAAIPLPALTRTDVQTLVVDAMLTRGLSVASVKGALVVLTAILAEAVQTDLVPRNVALGLRRRLKSRPVRRPTIYTSDQLALFVSTAERETPALAPLFALCAGAMLRIGEAQGVRGEDLYLSQRQLRVERTIRAGTRVGPTKSGHARVVDLSASCVRLLAPFDGRKGWCFPGRDAGSVISYTTVRLAMHRVCARAQIPPGSPHALRHALASSLAARGVSLPYLMQALGHADVKTTMLYCTHLPQPRPAMLDDL